MLHFAGPIHVSRSLEASIPDDISREETFNRFYIEHRKGVQWQYKQAKKVEIGWQFDTYHTVKMGELPTVVAIVSTVAKVVGRDVWVETWARSWKEYTDTLT